MHAQTGLMNSVHRTRGSEFGRNARRWSVVSSSGRGQLKSVSGAGHVRPCGLIKLPTLNSADNLELMTGRSESGPALQALLPAGPEFPDFFINNIQTKMINTAFSRS